MPKGLSDDGRKARIFLIVCRMRLSYNLNGRNENSFTVYEFKNISCVE